ncbi:MULTISPECIES: ATP-dependent helicase [Bacillales]|uniref:ATP-dependent helicase n=1 Tax=Bacillales TaxID=1385 RepID=UPI000361BEEC|nr:MULTISPECIES: ATP-dependent helicase [Bacillales]
MKEPMNNYEKKLNEIKNDEFQNAAYVSDKSTVVLAGPGSGKTTVLTLKIMKLLKEKIAPPQGLACVTFSKEAAYEFKHRLKKLGYQRRDNVFLGTVHSFCIAEVIGKFGHLYPKYQIPLPIKIISQKEKRKLFKQIKDELEIGDENLSLIELDKERSQNIKGKTRVEGSKNELAIKIAEEYERRLHSSGYTDFVSIVKFSTLLIQNESYVRKCLEAKFPWILVDEYQDLGRPLHEMILSFFNHTKIKIFAVGDPDQSIYGFGGAAPDYLIELYDLIGIERVRLITNYRSTQDIIEASELALNIAEKRNYVAGLRKEDAEFDFITCEYGMEQQYQYVVESIIPSCIEQNINLEEIALLVGYNDEIKDLSLVLENYKIPHYIAKHDFERSEIVLWLESCAMWTVDQSKASFEEIYEFWKRLLESHNKVITNKLDIKERRKVFDILTKNQQLSSNLLLWLRSTIQQFELKSLLELSTKYPEEAENLDNLLKVCADGKFKEYDVSKFTEIGKPENQVTVTTRHSSKGLEFEVVVLLGMEEGRFPYYNILNDTDKLAEAHRVFFVCVSRAKRVCYLIRSLRHTIYPRRGNPFEKRYPKSRFWSILEEKYGEA